MKRITFRMFITILVSMAFIACDNDDNDPNLHDAIILYMAPPDNCNAYVIQTDKYNFFKPSNLSDEYEIDSLQIRVAFDTTDNYHNCGFGGSIPIVEITGIKKK